MPLKYEILMDKKENPRKCTILPLKAREDFRIRYFRGAAPIDAFTSSVLLHVDGEDMADLQDEKIESIALIDCNWRKVEGAMARVVRPLPRLVRIPNGFSTAYARRNKDGNDPDAGLATIEALFLAAAFFGSWDESLFDKYYFKNDFLEKNKAMFERYDLRKYAKS